MAASGTESYPGIIAVVGLLQEQEQEQAQEQEQVQVQVRSQVQEPCFSV